MSSEDYDLKKSKSRIGDTRALEYINPNLLKPDPDQPRKKFDEEAIEKMATTLKTQNIINPIEVDESNVIITGEIRWRASKKAGLDRVPIIRLAGLDKDERRERQVIENLHQNALKDVELENAVYEMYLSGRYGKPQRGSGGSKNRDNTITKLAETIGYTQPYVVQIIEAKEFRDRSSNLLNKFETPPKTTHLRETSSLPDEDRIKVLKAASDGKIQTHGTETLATVSKVYKESSKPIKEKLLRGEIGLDEAKKISDRAGGQKLLCSTKEFLEFKRASDEAWARYEEEMEKADPNFEHIRSALECAFVDKPELTLKHICEPLVRFNDLDPSILTVLDAGQKEKVLTVLLESRKKIDEMVKAIKDKE